jgi:putative peptidoglycan lipid II flippase
LLYLPKPVSDHAKIITSIISVTLYVAGAKIVGALKEVALAARYGTGPTLDAYAVVFNLLTTPISIFAGASAVLVPLLLNLRRTSPAEHTDFFRECLGVTLVGGAIAGGVFALSIILAVHERWFGLDADVSRVVVEMVIPLSAMVPLGVLAALLAMRLMSGRRFVNTLFEAIPSVFLLVGALAIGRPGAGLLVWGTVAGFAAYVVSLLALPFGPRVEIIPLFRFRSPHWRETGASLGLILVSQAIFIAGIAADQVIVSHLGEGANATLGYANRLLMLLTSLGATAVARATLPVFAEVRLRNPGDEAKLAFYWMRILFVVSLAIVGICAVLAPVGVRILFQHGAFTARDTRSVTEVLRYGLLQLPFYFSSIVIVQLVASRRRYGVFILANTICVTLKIGSGIVLAPILGIKGVMVASAIMYAGSLAVLVLLASNGRWNPATPRAVL